MTVAGYPKCVSFVDPTLMDYEYHTVSWAEWLESVRKDAERLFGALKMRFRWISKAVEYQNIETLGYAVKVAAILHNRLLAHDNFDKFNWETMNPNRNDFEVEETEEEQIEIGPDKEAVQEDPIVEDLSGFQELSPTVADLAADLPVHAAVMPKIRLENQMEQSSACKESPGCPVPHGAAPRFHAVASRLCQLRGCTVQQAHLISLQLTESTCEVQSDPRQAQH